MASQSIINQREEALLHWNNGRTDRHLQGGCNQWAPPPDSTVLKAPGTQARVCFKDGDLLTANIDYRSSQGPGDQRVKEGNQISFHP